MRYLVCMSVCFFILCSCSNYSTSQGMPPSKTKHTVELTKPQPNYAARLPTTINIQEKVLLVDPTVHAWGAYANGQLIRAGLASAGSDWCADIKRRCRTKPGEFRIQSLGSPNCKSSIYPLPRGGAPMPYCMFFNGNQGLHGSPYSHVVEGNVSHGCVRLRVPDAEWIRYNFATIGTKVIVKPY